LLPFIAGGGDWKTATQVVAGGGGETRGTEEWQCPRSERGRHGRHRYSDSVADERGPRGFQFFLNYPNQLKLQI
jgi:hypothetical protein